MDTEPQEPMSEEQLGEVPYLINRIRLFGPGANMDPGEYTPPTAQELDDTLCALHAEVLRLRGEERRLRSMLDTLRRLINSALEK